MVKVTGAKVFSAKLRSLSGRGKDADLGRALFVAGEQIADYAKGSITKRSASGRKTKKHLHVPSRPGEAPNADTGVLDRNIETVQVRPLLVEVSSNAPYSAALEKGTSKMAPRPFMGPAVIAKKDEAIALVQKALDHILAGGSLR